MIPSIPQTLIETLDSGVDADDVVCDTELYG